MFLPGEALLYVLALKIYKQNKAYMTTQYEEIDFPWFSSYRTSIQLVKVSKHKDKPMKESISTEICKLRFVTSHLVLGIYLLVFLGFLPIQANAQFDQLLKGLQKEIQKIAPPQGANVTTGNFPGGLITPERIEQRCVEMFMGADHEVRRDRELIDPNSISREFKIRDLDQLQEVFFQELRRRNLSKTFPHADFFVFEFETPLVNTLYQSFLAFPEPQTLAFIIQLSKSEDRQFKGDALMALSFLHLQAPKLSVSENRWRELFDEAMRPPLKNYLAYTFAARVFLFGELGPQSNANADRYLIEASSHVSAVKSSAQTNESMAHLAGNYAVWDNNNFAVVQQMTMKELMRVEPSIAARYAKQKAQFQSMAGLDLDRLEAQQQAYAKRFPQTRAGKMAREIDKINQETANIGVTLISATQGGNQALGELKSFESLVRKEQGDRAVYVANPAERDAFIFRLAQKTNALAAGKVDPKATQLFVQAQEKRYQAQALLFTAQMELLNDQSGGGLLAKVEPMKQFQRAFVSSCQLSTKWELAMRSRDIPAIDKNKAVAEVGSRASMYKDD